MRKPHCQFCNKIVKRSKYSKNKFYCFCFGVKTEFYFNTNRQLEFIVYYVDDYLVYQNFTRKTTNIFKYLEYEQQIIFGSHIISLHPKDLKSFINRLTSVSAFL